MKKILLIITLFNIGYSFGQNFSYPSISFEGQSITDFIPKEWSVLNSETGDLNNDNYQDFALVLQYNDSVKVIKYDNGNSDTVITMPRILIIVFWIDSTKSYKLIEQSNSFILDHDNPDMFDPFSLINIENGVLNIDFQLFYTMGSWSVTNTSYKFCYLNDEFVLIGAKNNTFYRNTSDYEVYNYNFLQMSWTLTKGNDKTEQEDTTESFVLDKKELKTFKTFSKPYTWEVTKEVFL